MSVSEVRDESIGGLHWGVSGCMRVSEVCNEKTGVYEF